MVLRRGANLDDAKGLNRRVAFEAIYRNGPISRNDVAARMQVTPQTVSNIVSEFEPYGLIDERPVHTGKKGKPAREYSIHPNSILNIGLHIDQHRVSALLTNVAGEDFGRRSAPLANQDPSYVEGVAAKVVEALVHADPSYRSSLLGVGVAMPGIFQDGVFLSGNALTMTNWKGHPLAQTLSERLGLPVFVENDATAAAIGEGLFGQARNVASYVFFYFGMGLGGGLMINGTQYVGAHNRSAEIGHMIVDPGGRDCPCGNKGCLERYVSLFSAYQAITESETEFEAVPPKAISDAFLSGDKRLKAWSEAAAMHLYTAINIVQNVIDPDAIYLGGQLPHELLNALAHSVMEQHRTSQTDPDNSARLRLEVVSGDVARGAAALPLSTLLNPPVNGHTGLDYVRPTDGASLYNLLSG